MRFSVLISAVYVYFYLSFYLFIAGLPHILYNFKWVFWDTDVKIPEIYSSIYYKCISHIFTFLSTSGVTVYSKKLVSRILPRHLLIYASWRISSLFRFEAKAFVLSTRVFMPVRNTAKSDY